MGKLRQEIAAALPRSLFLPQEFVAALDWIDAAEAVGRTTHGNTLFGALDPSFVRATGGSCIMFHPVAPDHAASWTGSKDASVTDRLAPFVRTGGDGSYAALWLDDNGGQRFVHLGSGSGSLMTGVMVRTPLDFLRLLAIGYEEICWPEALGMSPLDAAGNPDLLKPPMRFRTWLASTYGVTIPAIALDVMLPLSEMDKPSDDPFCRWLDRIRGG